MAYNDFKKERYRGPSMYKKVRKLVSNNKTGDVYGITIPTHIAEEFRDAPVKLTISGEGILIERSGCILFIDEDNYYDKE